ncbi:MAG TPA: EAL domain-containing protein [Acidobacteriaceae bacterium]|nr:EAL domain-containing protein [Acidobacteriaceae bacterium]
MKQEETAAVRGSESSAAAANNRILVVDDEELNRDLCVRRLERKGFEVKAVPSGQEALAMLEDESFAVVLLDHMMPGLSGLEVLRTLRQSWTQQELPIIMVTAVADSASIAEALDLGANDYVTKPIDFSVAIARIRSQLSRRHAEMALRRSEERYALAARGANDGLWDWNLETGAIYFSPRWKEMLGLEDNGAAGDKTSWTALIHEKDRPLFETALERHLSGSSPAFECEYRMRRPDGSCRWMSTRGLAVRNAAGAAIRMAGSQSDITEKITRDVLTGLPNRVLFTDRLLAARERAGAEGKGGFAVLFLDLDRFKLINDSMGHVVGDRLLQEVARRIRAGVRDGSLSGRKEGDSLVARLSGDEFAVLLDDIPSAAAAEAVCERIARSMRPAFRWGEDEIYVSMSMGIVVSSSGIGTPEELIRDADAAMYAAKSAGGGRWALFEPSMHDLSRRRLQTESDLRRALDREEFRVFYQPRVLLETGAICGFEALARWQHPTRGLIQPNDFIPIAEDTGLIIPIGLWVLREACRQMHAWHAVFASDPPLDIAVNLSVRQCREKNLVHQIAEILHETGLPPECLHLELTESVLLEDLEQARGFLSELKALGVGLKLDDFGTGYSCLRYLSGLPFDSLKIDRSFMVNMQASGADTTETAIVHTIVGMAGNLRLGVIAEGIEREEQITRLLAMGCKYGQGYYFSRPVDAEATEHLLVENRLAMLPEAMQPAAEGTGTETREQ